MAGQTNGQSKWTTFIEVQDSDDVSAYLDKHCMVVMVWYCVCVCRMRELILTPLTKQSSYKPARELEGSVQMTSKSNTLPPPTPTHTGVNQTE